MTPPVIHHAADAPRPGAGRSTGPRRGARPARSAALRRRGLGWPLLLALHGLGVPLAVPVVTAPDTPLVFRPWTPGTATARSTFGVEEPQSGGMVVPDLLLVPLLAFDPRGHRLGYGGGFYDRTLAALRAAGPVRALGLAYAAQQVPRVPSGRHDAPLDAIVTERGVLTPA